MPPNQFHTFQCIDGHTCGNPVRLVSGGGPLLQGATMSERRQDFLAKHDWVRRALMFEPRGHDVMSGSILYPPTRADCDIGILFIEVSGCLPMCGHGTIGTVTMAIENGLVSPRVEGQLALDAPAGRVVAEYRREGRFVEVGTNPQRALLSRGGGRAHRCARHGRAGGRCRLWRQFLRDHRPAAEFRRGRVDSRPEKSCA